MSSYAQWNAVSQWFWILLLALAIREGVRKGIALRKAGSKKHLIRFICLFIFNTAGILPIIYIVFFANKNKQETKQFIETIEQKAGEKIKHAEWSIEHTIEKVEKLIKKAPVIAKKPVAKKAK